MQVLVCLMLSKRSLKVSSFLNSFLSSVQFMRFSLLCLPDHWFVPLYHLIYCWFLLGYFLILAIVFFCYVWFFFIFSNSVEILTVFIHSSPKFIEHFIFIILNTLSDILLFSTSLHFFSGILLCFFIWNILLCLIFPILCCLLLCVR